MCWGTNDQSDVQGWVWDFFDNSALGIVITNPVVQNCGAAQPCPGDLDGDSAVGASDLAVLLGQWGSSGSGDLDGSGSVGSADLAILLGGWGGCP